MLYQYYLLVTSERNEEISDIPYDTYGIALRNHNEVAIKDISTDKKFVSYLVDLCNINQVDPAHLLDVIYDTME